MTKLERLRADLARLKAKREVLEAKIQDLEARCIEEEHSVILNAVYTANVTPEQLPALLANAAKGIVGIYPEDVETVPTPEAYKNDESEED